MSAGQYLVAMIMLVILIGSFVAMARYEISQALVMPLVASAFLTLGGTAALGILEKSFAEFAPVAIIFTAIAIPAHQLQRSHLFRLVGAQLGRALGNLGIRFPNARVTVLVSLALFMTWVAAGLLHNVTAILVMVPIIIAICESYELPSRWVLCGALIASNLGGFSTAWGDTPNIIESRVWGLSHAAFFREILPLNLIVLTGLTAAVVVLTRRELRRRGVSPTVEQTAWSIAGFMAEGREFALDRRLVFVGLTALTSFIVVQFLSRELEIAAGAAAILYAVAGDRRADRLHTLQSLGLDVYMTLIAVFVIANSISHSLLGMALQSLINETGAATWAIAISSYLGTGLTEAASWASAVAPMTHEANPSHAAAWALGAGICAGSSSLLTAASAGIILWTETRRFDGHAVTFGSYLWFGLPASLAILGFYIAAITTMDKLELLP